MPISGPHTQAFQNAGSTSVKPTSHGEKNRNAASRALMMLIAARSLLCLSLSIAKLPFKDHGPSTRQTHWPHPKRGLIRAIQRILLGRLNLLCAKMQVRQARTQTPRSNIREVSSMYDGLRSP